MIGQTISHYKILEKLGEGGMGVVYKAQDTKLLRSVALKFLTPEMTRDEDAKKRFIREARAASALDHPNIAVVHEIDETKDGRSFICMAYYEGQTLKEKLARGPLGVTESAHMILQIADGLQRAHESGIVHRDIKPGNIMTTPRGDVKIVDFGLAKLAAQTRASRTGPTAGTAAYMSPEQIMGSEADTRSDLFSLGVLFYEAITGKRPFIGEHEPALFYSIVNAEPVPPATIRPDIPEELERIILRLLEKDPKKRYQSAGELRADLKRILGEEPTPRPLKRLASLSKRRFAAPAAIIVSLLIVVGALSVTGTLKGLFGGPPLPEQIHIVVLPFNNIGADPEGQVFCEGLAEVLTSKLSQLQSPGRDLWVVEAGEVRRRNITSVSVAYQAFAISLAVTGSVQRQDNHVTLTLNLVDPQTLHLIDARVVERDSESLSSLMDETVAAVAGMVEIQLKPEVLQVLAAGSTTDSKAYELYILARGFLSRYERTENVATAIDNFHQALRADSSYALAYAGLGEAYWRQYENTKDAQWVDSAIASCKQALKLNDQLAAVYLTLGIIDRGTGKYEQSVDALQRSIELDPLSTDAYRELAIAYQSLRDMAKAEQAYKQAIELKPSYWAGYNALGGFYYRTGRYDDAVAQFEQVIKYTPDNMRGYNNLGGTHFKLKHWQLAQQMFERSIQIDSVSNYVAFSQLGTLYFYMGRFQDAARAFEKALEIRDTDYRIRGYLASAYRWSPVDQQRAQEIFEIAALKAEEQRKVNPRDAELLYNLAGYYAALGKQSEALSLLNQALLLAPDNVQVLGRCAMVFEELGRRDRALVLLERAMKGNFSPTELEFDPAMKELREDPKYQRLVDANARDNSRR